MIRARDPAGIVVAALLLAAAAVIAWDTSNIPISSVYGLGPEAMPTVVAGGLALLAVGNLVMAFRGDMPEREPIDLKAIFLILGGFGVLMLVIGFDGGFIPATAILFAATSAAFGRRAFLTDLVIGLVLAVLVYLMFVKVLSLSLPMGPIERLL